MKKKVDIGATCPNPRPQRYSITDPFPDVEFEKDSEPPPIGRMNALLIGVWTAALIGIVTMAIWSAVVQP
jgi:hypothetical protein